MKWRLIRDGAARGAWNMAVDEALMRHQADVDARPTLRFYSWNPSCLSMGRFQKSLVVNENIDIVRRPSGGRAVWHEHEITYSAAFRLAIVPANATSVIGSYRWLTGAFLDGLRDLGIAAELAAPRGDLRDLRDLKGDDARGGDLNRVENCFLSVAACDTIVDGRKLIGAAQCRSTINGEVVVLQHGSLLLDVDVAAWRRALGDEAQTMRKSVVTLRELGVTTARSEIEAALCAGLSRVVGASWEEAELNASEWESAQCLGRDKYGVASWNRDGRATPESEISVVS